MAVAGTFRLRQNLRALISLAAWQSRLKGVPAVET
jgi:hypothetical protein